MREYLKVANGNMLYLCGVVIALIVFLQALLFIRLSFKEGTKHGLSKKQMIKAIRTGATVSFIPAISIVISLIAMAPVLGIPFPWLRLSIIGSAPYELLAAGVGAKAMGVDSLGGEGFTREVFANSVWIMTLGSFWAVSIVVFFLKKYQKSYSKFTNDPAWKSILINSAFLGVFCVFIADPVTSGGLPLITLLAGAILMTIFAVLIVRLKVKWLKEFALTLSMILAMVIAAIFSNIVL